MTCVLPRRDRDTQGHTRGRRLCKEEGRDGSEAATSQGRPRVAGRHQRLEGSRMDPPRTFRGEHSLANTLISDFGLPKLREDTFLLL